MRLPRSDGAPAHPQRDGYTLLEVVLALAVASLLLGGLYVAMDLQCYGMRTGRDLTNRAEVARAVLNQFNRDISSNLAPIDPKMAPKSSSAAPTTDSTTTDSTMSGGGSSTGPFNFNL